MAVVNQQTQQQISDLVNACEGYWELRGIREERRAEMRLELEQHLEQAVGDGKSLQAVVGPNSLAFAESWAQETPRHFSGGFAIILRWLAFDWLPYALALVGLLALAQHLLLLSSSFTFTLDKAIVSFAFIGLFTLLQAFAGFLSPRVGSREKRLMLAFGIYAVISLLIVLVLHLAKVPLDMILFRWHWPVTLLLIVGTLGLFSGKAWLARATRQEEQSS